jgi:adenine-specific DNA-methyltransferase
LLTATGSVFVQIGDENIHHVREVLDETFGSENAVAVIAFKKTTGAGSASIGTNVIPSVFDYILWYALDKSRVRYTQLYLDKDFGGEGASQYEWLELSSGERRRMTAAERSDPSQWPLGARPFGRDNLTSPTGVDTTRFPVDFEGVTYRPHPAVWKTSAAGMERLKSAKRLIAGGEGLYYVRYLADFPARPLTNFWTDTQSGGTYAGKEDRFYVVQTNTRVVERCMLMTTEPGDLVLDPTCGSGTTAYVSEQWGRRWITIDTSRVPLALARQRLLTATFSWYQLKEAESGPRGGFIYKRRQNNKGDEIGGIIPHVTLKSIANDEPPGEEVIVDRPQVEGGVTRVAGPFCIEATIPTPVDWDGDGVEDTGSAEAHGSFVDRMLDALRRSPVLRLDGKKSVNLKNVRRPAKTLSLSAEALTAENGDKPVAFVFGPENGAVSEKLVWEAAREAKAKDYAQLYVIGFSIQPHARQLVESSHATIGIPATYVQATPDLLLGDLLKTMRSSEIFSVCGLPEIKVNKLKDGKHQVQLLGLDLFDPVTMEAIHRDGGDVPVWLLDTDYNGLVFLVTQAFFPRTGAWDSLKKALKAEYAESVWDHLAGTTSAPFEGGDHQQIAVKVIDDRGNELLVVKSLAGSH